MIRLIRLVIVLFPVLVKLIKMRKSWSQPKTQLIQQCINTPAHITGYSISMDQVFYAETAVFAAGCFWGVQFYFDQVPGVLKSEVGYTGGRTKNPTYEEVCYTDTGHVEAVRLEFNPNTISYETLARHFFRLHNPTQIDRQGPDIGAEYRSMIYYTSPEQQEIAENVKKELQPNYDKPIATRIASAKTFWLAEDYHQKFTERTGHGMCHVPYKEIQLA